LFFRQVLYRDLGCASYMLGDSGEAVVVDPRWDIEEYLELARVERLRIVHVVDTHDHADHVSGRVRLAGATGARAHRPSNPADDCDDRIDAGDEIAVGNVRLRAIATPGHRPEHLAFAVSDLGLIEMTRQRVRQSHYQSMTGPCPTCDGTGRVFTPETIIRRMERSVRRMVNEGRKDNLLVKLHPEVAMYVLEEEKEPEPGRIGQELEKING